MTDTIVLIKQIVLSDQGLTKKKYIRKLRGNRKTVFFFFSEKPSYSVGLNLDLKLLDAAEPFGKVQEPV